LVKVYKNIHHSQNTCPASNLNLPKLFQPCFTMLPSPSSPQKKRLGPHSPHPQSPPRSLGHQQKKQAYTSRRSEISYFTLSKTINVVILLFHNYAVCDMLFHNYATRCETFTLFSNSFGFLVSLKLSILILPFWRGELGNSKRNDVDIEMNTANEFPSH
jgi:hypothetical protein